MSSDGDSKHDQNESNSSQGPAKDDVGNALVAEPNSSKQQQQAANKARRTPEERSHFWNVVTTVGVWAYTLLTAIIMIINVLQWQTGKDNLQVAKNTFDAAERPYVGVSDVGVAFYKADGGATTDASQATMAKFVVELKNFGPVPATNYFSEWHAYIDGVKMLMKRTAPDDGHTTIFPGGHTDLWYRVDGVDFLDIQQKRKILRFEIPFSYDGPGHHYTGCEVDQYNPPNNEFLLGPSCTTPTTMDKQETPAKRPEWPNR
jgi:hypothetical protein